MCGWWLIGGRGCKGDTPSLSEEKKNCVSFVLGYTVTPDSQVLIKKCKVPFVVESDMPRHSIPFSAAEVNKIQRPHIEEPP